MRSRASATDNILKRGDYTPIIFFIHKGCIKVLSRSSADGFHDVGQVFDACQNTAELGKVFNFDDEPQICNAAVDVDRNIIDVDILI